MTPRFLTRSGIAAFAAVWPAALAKDWLRWKDAGQWPVW